MTAARPRRVLFLDVDGVLNGAEWIYHRRKFDEPDLDPPAGLIDSACCERINRVVRETGCDIVLSSAWRRCNTLEENKSIFESRGLNVNRFVGETPAILDCLPGGRERTRIVTYERGPTNGVHVERGLEIQHWLDENDGSDAVIAIVDDSDDMAHLLPRLVQTEWETGITDADVEKLIALLTETCPMETGSCDCGAARAVFVPEAAKGLSSDEVRRRWPRRRCSECSTIVYASYLHYASGDW